MKKSLDKTEIYGQIAYIKGLLDNLKDCEIEDAIDKIDDISNEMDSLDDMITELDDGYYEDEASIDFEHFAERVTDLLPVGSSVADEEAISSYIRSYGKY